jgi:hypothetical protein
MIRERIIGITICIVLTAGVVSGQQPNGQRTEDPASSVIEHASDGRATPWRVVRTRTASAGREVVVETVAAPNVDGLMSRIQETVTETSRSTPAGAQTRRDVFGFGGDGRRQLLMTTESQQTTQQNRDTNGVHSTFTPDVNGRSTLTSRTIENTRTVTPTLRQADTTQLQPDVDGALRETSRVERTERTDASVVRHESTELVRDLNGRWLAIERRDGEALASGASEETIERMDMNGKATVVERRVSRSAGGNEPDDVVIEMHIPYVDRWAGSVNGLALSERTHRTTTRSADGARSTIEEVEGRNPVSPGDPMRVIRRTVTTVRPSGTDRWTTEREIFERDVNGRMQRISVDSEESSAR